MFEKNASFSKKFVLSSFLLCQFKFEFGGYLSFFYVDTLVDRRGFCVPNIADRFDKLRKEVLFVGSQIKENTPRPAK